MGWMLQLGEDGYSEEYVQPSDAEVQGTTNIREVDVYRKFSDSVLSFLFISSPILYSQVSDRLWFSIYLQMLISVLQ